MKDLQINPLFKALIPPLTAEEYSLLKQSINEDGCRDTLKVWNDTIVDGHNRYEICRELEVEFETEEMSFLSEDYAMVWIINNQLGRRNMTDYQKAELVLKRKNILLGKGKEKMSDGGKGLSTLDKPSHNTQKEMAKDAGVSSGTMARIETIAKEATEEMKEQLRNGELKVGTAYRQLQEEKQHTENTSNSIFNKTTDDIELAKYTWDPVTGCQYDCPYCYAKDEAMKFTGHFNPEFHEDKLDAPYNTALDKENNRVLLCPSSDLFGEWVPDEQIQKIIDICKATPQWTYLCLTKNPKRYLNFIFPKNMWLGMTCDTQGRFDASLPVAKELKNRQSKQEWKDKGWKANIVFVAFEPLKENIIVKPRSQWRFDWVIIGGQSKTSGEPEFQPEWDWVKYLLATAQVFSLVYFKSNLTVRPRELPEEEYEDIEDQVEVSE
jgi:protein gp37